MRRFTTDEQEATQYGKLVIIAKLGELMPDNGGTGKGKSKAALLFSRPIAATYRKVASYKESLADYRDAVAGACAVAGVS